MKDYVLEGKAYWSNIHEPDSEYFNPTYRLNLTISPEKSAKLASEGVKIQRLDYKTHDQYFFMLQKKACYGDIDYPAPAVYDKEGNKFELDDEIPNGHPVKVKFRIVKGKSYDSKVASLIAIKLLEDIPHEFDNVESF